MEIKNSQNNKDKTERKNNNNIENKSCENKIIENQLSVRKNKY